MKRLICILAGAALLGACEQKTEVVTPVVPSPPAKSETGQKVRKTTSESAVSVASPATSTEMKTESTTTTTTTASPNP